jgi:mannose-6-phosphate isomerase-like protein (cupin superfamily)
MREARPWGWYEVLYDGAYKVKRIRVEPHKRLSLQSHRFRRELWHVVEGAGAAVLGEEIVRLVVGTTLVIEPEQKHRLINDSDEDLEIVEIQTGSYFGEDDIVRYEDDFRRA